MSGETIPLMVTSKINWKLKFVYKKSEFLTPELRKMPYNALIHSHFRYACSACYANLTKKKEKREIQIMQNKCIRFP